MSEVAYQILLTDARDFANHDPRKPLWLGGDFFKLPLRFDSFALHYDVDQLKMAMAASGAEQTETLRVLVSIVQDAIVRAIHENPAMMGGLVLDQAKKRASS